MSTVSSFLRSFTLAIALREYLAGSTPPRAGVERRGGDDHLRYQKEGGRRLEVIEEEDEGTEEEPGEGSRITHDTPHGDTVLRTNSATNHEDLGLRFTKKHSLRAQRNSSFEIEHSRMLTKSRSNKGLLFKQDALQENGSVKYHSADYSSGDCRNIWHDSHAVIMNIALRAIPSIQVSRKEHVSSRIVESLMIRPFRSFSLALLFLRFARDSCPLRACQVQGFNRHSCRSFALHRSNCPIFPVSDELTIRTCLRRRLHWHKL